MSGEYPILASFYDRIGFGQFAERIVPRIVNYIQQNDWMGRRILDLGCGTGASARWFAQHSYSVVALDKSEAMLNQMKQALVQNQSSIEYVHTDIAGVSGIDRIDLALAIDTLNEIDGLRQLDALFRSVIQTLNNDRFFVFDMHTIAGLIRKGMDGDKIIYDADGLTVINKVVYDFERQILTNNYSLFMVEDGVRWRREDAQRTLRAFPIQAVAALLKRLQFELISILRTDLSEVGPGDVDVDRVIFIVRKTKV